MSIDAAQWQWERGIEIAVQGLKLLFLLNGGSAVAILAFLGSSHANSTLLILAMSAFAVGALCAVVACYFGYRAQLAHGNSSLNAGTLGGPAAWKQHKRAYLSVGASAGLYIAGIALATCGLFYPHYPL